MSTFPLSEPVLRALEFETTTDPTLSIMISITGGTATTTELKIIKTWRKPHEGLFAQTPVGNIGNELSYADGQPARSGNN